MAIKLYMDHNVPKVITNALRLRGVDVINAGEDGAAQIADADLLNRAGALGRSLFTMDIDFLTIAAELQQAGKTFGGIIYAHQLQVSIRTCIEQLELIAKAGEPEDLIGKIEFLPLK